MPTSYHSGQKRSVCDRCREQKLRCRRDDRDESNLEEPCDRCQRLSAKCITSEAKPLGRPRTCILDSGPAVSSPASPMTPETLLSPSMSSSTLDISFLSTSPLPTDLLT
ncbi:hypothetical protein QBC47DRAFT_385634 [Echria macrotheca]|uniref:Zn(2)-C6 fungal-type domain-containing protein n=1 Tax=Echria macrotheca TaxID=438768 RepID=A0AAJ0FAF1_9PEZI|nr:hypothetical protein QBC47DRAFT_385634 [Echria macrotheca]